MREGTPPDKVNQDKSRGIEGKLSSPSEIRGISGIRITSKQWYPPIQIGILWVWRYVYVWVYVFLWVMEGVWETKGNGRRRWRGVGPAGRPSLFPFGGSIILKFDIDMTREEARNVFGGSIVNNLLSLGAEPTNVVRQDGLIEWKSDGYIEVGGVQVWAYYYFENGEDVDRCDWADHMEIEIEECWI